MLEPVFGENDIYDIDTTLNGNGNILIKIDFTYDDEIDNMAHLKRFMTQIQQVRKRMGLKPWNRISVEINCDDFNIVSKNIDYIITRLECNINPVSQLEPKLFYTNLDNEDEANDTNMEINTNTEMNYKKIGYSILLLD